MSPYQGSPRSVNAAFAKSVVDHVSLVSPVADAEVRSGRAPPALLVRLSVRLGAPPPSFDTAID
jgi:hypothetical protein